MDKNNHFSNILKTRLEGMNLSQLSRELGVSKSLIFEWAKASRKPSFKHLPAVRKLADKLGISFEHLLFGYTEKNDEILSMVFEDHNRKFKIKIERIK